MLPEGRGFAMISALALGKALARRHLPEMIAISFCVIFGAISLVVPPFMFLDEAFGFMAWRGTLLGHMNSVLAPDPANIARDLPTFLAAYSPGQYLIPGLISLLGVPLGVAITVTVTLSSFAYLLGWLAVLRKFSTRALRHEVMFVCLLATVRYATLPYGNYDGGEVLLQAAFPWIVLAAFKLSSMGFVRGALLLFATLLVAFLAKLSGLIVVIEAVLAVSLLYLSSGPKIGTGLIGGWLGIAIGSALIYFGYISQGWTAVSDVGWSLPVNKIVAAIDFPWLAGLSWTDFMNWILLRPGQELLARPDLRAWIVLPVAAFVMILIGNWKPETASERQFKSFTLLFYAIATIVFIFLFARGSALGMEERHFRPIGMLILMCCFLTVTSNASRPWCIAFCALCIAMSIYGLSSFLSRANRETSNGSLDRPTWIHQEILDEDAISYARSTYVLEGRGALYVLADPEAAISMPVEARTLAFSLDFTQEHLLETWSYRGHVPRHVYVILQRRLAETRKGHDVLAAFKDYCATCWEKKDFQTTAVFISRN
jgi:hypothetical protein